LSAELEAVKDRLAKLSIALKQEKDDNSKQRISTAITRHKERVAMLETFLQ